MLHRTACFSLGLALFAGSAMAAVPADGNLPAGKPALNRASPMINDPLLGKPIHGKPQAARPVQQVVLPGTDKPALNRASPLINDPLTPPAKPGTP